MRYIVTLFMFIVLVIFLAILTFNYAREAAGPLKHYLDSNIALHEGIIQGYNPDPDSPLE
jgi:hypothetical protein